MLHPRSLLKQLGLRARKGLSQSFLADAQVARLIVDSARLVPNDEVLEVGPGLGMLTRLLVQRAKRVVAVELDAELASALPDAIASPGLEVHNADILRFEPSRQFETPFVVVANLPYHITSPALRHLLSGPPPTPDRLIVMVQKEVAERIVAPPGALSALAVAVQAQARAEIVLKVSARSFYPVPKVDSAVLQLVPLAPDGRVVEPHRHEAFTLLVREGFTQPRKTVANSLTQGSGLPKTEVEALLERAGIATSVRPQQVTLEQWAHLLDVWPITGGGT